MKKNNHMLAALIVGTLLFSSGCIDAVRLGFTDGLNSAISSAVETFIGDAITPAPAE